MKGATIALDLWDGRKAAALVIDGRLEDVIVDPPPDGPPLPGTMFLGLADRPMKGLGGVFVRLPGGATGFLRGGGARPGRPVTVQVSGYAEPGKAVPLSGKPRLTGRFTIVTPQAPGLNVSRKVRAEAARQRLLETAAGIDMGDSGAILRSAAADASPERIRDELTGLLRAAADLGDAGETEAPSLLSPGPDAHALAGRDWPEAAALDAAPGAFERNGIVDMLEEMASPRVAFASGGGAWIEPTRAHVAIDVDTGGDTSPAAGLKANLALARDLPRQLRCRGLGGQIVIDAAPMPKRDRRQVDEALRSAFRGDPIDTAIVGWTALGHVELQRRRGRLPLSGA